MFILKFTGDEKAEDKIWTAYATDIPFIAEVTIRNNGDFKYVGRVKAERGEERLNCFKFKQALEAEALQQNETKFGR